MAYTINELETELLEIFKKVFNQPDLVIDDKMTASEVKNWDSLSHMIMINEVEQFFQIKFKLKDLNKMKNVGALKDIILEKTNDNA